MRKEINIGKHKFIANMHADGETTISIPPCNCMADTICEYRRLVDMHKDYAGLSFYEFLTKMFPDMKDVPG